MFPARRPAFERQAEARHHTPTRHQSRLTGTNRGDFRNLMNTGSGKPNDFDAVDTLLAFPVEHALRLYVRSKINE
jgi:hypothetical protein